jgi:phosphoribosylaminoimidazole-succinocarboxamide synthase
MAHSMQAGGAAIRRAVFETRLPLPGRRQGKVRDVYELPPMQPGGVPRLLIVATDRISAFDVVMPTPIPGKGILLTAISAAWFRFIEQRGLVATHVLPGPLADALKGVGLSREHREMLEGRTTVARRCRVVPVECVVRGYLAGSGWVEYQAHGTVCGVALPPGLRQGDRLPEAIFTPATKAEQGEHDENISFERACEIAGRGVMERLRSISLAIFGAASAHALQRGVILADTKFEFGFPLDAQGRDDGEPILVDEALTPDSSRFWPADEWRPGQEQPSFDKQYLREHLLRLVAQGQWAKQPPAPALPEEVVRNTRARYEEAARRLFGDGTILQAPAEEGR